MERFYYYRSGIEVGPGLSTEARLDYQENVRLIFVSRIKVMRVSWVQILTGFYGLSHLVVVHSLNILLWPITKFLKGCLSVRFEHATAIFSSSSP
ncbi:hypothetical protein Zmor_004919 [Zophobas morio]|uniref:Uncharacterized protein n=1 Tax=Zophobas morio TaxID=2755281 RepID=A0AA38ML16_9CUCU|nr:hypothetical protein Zmor_004919 [Zophobas morio]